MLPLWQVVDRLCLLPAHPPGDDHTEPGELPSPRCHALAGSLHLPVLKDTIKNEKSLSFATSLSHFNYI